MRQRVYIQASAFYSEEKRLSSDRDLDRISRMCIQTVERLNIADPMMEFDVPLFVGSAYGCLSSLYEFNRVYESEGALRVNPSLFPNTVLNAPACRTGIAFQIRDPIYTISNGPSSGLDTLELAYQYIAHGDVRKAIVCVVEEDSSIAAKISGHSLDEGCFAFYLQADRALVEIAKVDFQTQAETESMDYCRTAHKFISEWDAADGNSCCVGPEGKMITLERIKHET